ncbi:MAG: hypothetical protein QXO17_00170 [Nitrososphaerota archaeon]|nr:hypothetical protein [Candidatus Calditenuis fumarioli]
MTGSDRRGLPTSPGLEGKDLLEVIEGHVFLLPGRLIVVHWFERSGNVTRPGTLVIDVSGVRVEVLGAAPCMSGWLYGVKLLSDRRKYILLGPDPRGGKGHSGRSG